MIFYISVFLELKLRYCFIKLISFMQVSDWFEGIMVLFLLSSYVVLHLFRQELLYTPISLFTGTGILESGMKFPLL